jgi:glyoxylate/hydroxypyruvate reductase A
MSLAIISPGKNPNAWIKVIRKLDPTLKIQVYPDISNPDESVFKFEVRISIALALFTFK